MENICLKQLSVHQVFTPYRLVDINRIKKLTTKLNKLNWYDTKILSKDS